MAIEKPTAEEYEALIAKGRDRTVQLTDEEQIKLFMFAGPSEEEAAGMLEIVKINRQNDMLLANPDMESDGFVIV